MCQSKNCLLRRSLPKGKFSVSSDLKRRSAKGNNVNIVIKTDRDEDINSDKFSNILVTFSTRLLGKNIGEYFLHAHTESFIFANKRGAEV